MIGNDRGTRGVWEYGGVRRSHIDRQLDTDMMKAVPTPRLDVGENVLAAQLLLVNFKSL